MAENIYQAIMTRNAELAKFTDSNPEVALLFKKIVGVVANIAHDWRCDASKITFEPHASPDGKFIYIQVKRPKA